MVGSSSIIISTTEWGVCLGLVLVVVVVVVVLLEVILAGRTRRW